MKANIFVATLSLFYWFCTNELIFAFVIIVLYLLGLGLCRTICKNQHIIESLYSLFFIAYSLLVVLSHKELIRDPFEDFYIHNDAAWSFYTNIMEFVLPCKWSEIYEKTLGGLLFFHYPLAAFLFGIWGKIGLTIGIEDLRLFFRLHSVFLAVFVIVFMSKILCLYNIRKGLIKKYIILFGICTYLFISSAIFSRDIHVTLLYTIAAYLFLNPSLKRRLFWFSLIFVLTLGMRPQSGLLMLVYPFFYYFNMIFKRIGFAGLFLLAMIGLVGSYYMTEYISMTSDSIEELNEMQQEENSGGLFNKLYNLPFPINTIIMVFYILIQPLPFGKFILEDGGTWLNLTTILSPYLISLAVAVCLMYLYHNRSFDNKLSMLIVASLLAFTAIVFGSPDVRRAFAAIPGLYMCFCIIYQKYPKALIKKIKLYIWPFLFLINLFFGFYVYLR